MAKQRSWWLRKRKTLLIAAMITDFCQRHDSLARLASVAILSGKPSLYSSTRAVRSQNRDALFVHVSSHPLTEPENKVRYALIPPVVSSDIQIPPVVSSEGSLKVSHRQYPAQLEAMRKRLQLLIILLKGHFDNLFDSVGTWFKAMGEDLV